MASNVASGVGFIGAGVITNNRKSNGVYDKTSSVRGLTTASAIWVSAAVGVCAGAGLYFISFIAAVGTITILRVGKWRGVIDDLKDLKDFKLEMAAREEIKEKEMREKVSKRTVKRKRGATFFLTENCNSSLTTHRKKRKSRNIS